MSGVLPFLANAGEAPQRLMAMAEGLDPERIPNIEGVRAAIRLAGGDLEGARREYLDAARDDPISAADAHLSLGNYRGP